jgi:hypothetical protein
LGARIGWVLVVYPGVVALVAFPWILRWLVMRRATFVVVLTIQLLVACLGNIPGVVKWMQSQSLSIPIRYPDKLLLGAIAIMIIVTWDRTPLLVRWMKAHKKWRWFAIGLVWICSWPLVAICAREVLLDRYYPGFPGYGSTYVPARLVFEALTTRDIFYVTGAGIVVWCGIRFLWNSRLIIALLAIVSTVDVFAAGIRLGVVAEYVSPEAWSSEGLSKLIKPGRIWRTDDAPLIGSKSGAGLDSVAVRGIQNSSIHSLYKGIELGRSDGWVWLQGANVFSPRRSRVFSNLANAHPPMVVREILYRTSTQYAMGYPGRLAKYQSILDSCLADQSGEVALCGLKDKRRKFDIRSRLRCFPTDSALVHNMVELQVDRSSLYIRDPGGSSLIDLGSPHLLPHIVSIDDSIGSRRRIELSGGGEGWLAMASSWDPGWRVSVDGKPAELLRLDYALCGVHLPKGAQMIEFEYSPPYLVLSLWISLGLIGCVSCLLRSNAMRLHGPGWRWLRRI